MSNNKNEIIKITNEQSLVKYKQDYISVVETLYRILKVIIIICIFILLIKEREFLSIFISGADIVPIIAGGFGFIGFVGMVLGGLAFGVYLIFELLFTPLRNRR